MCIRDRYYLQEKFFKETGTYYYAPQGNPADYIADDKEYEEELLKGCGFIIISWVIIVALFTFITYKFF